MQSVLVKMLRVLQRDQRSADAARQIHKNRVSPNSPGRILVKDVLESL
jgi:hypothetical protein